MVRPVILAPGSTRASWLIGQKNRVASPRPEQSILSNPLLAEYDGSQAGNPMNPEEKARQQIDAMLTASGWVVQTKDKINLRQLLQGRNGRC